ncbi:MAG: hypothetical protein HFJ58_01040 [Clostridia bacterium]|nr:hypothetical protein [Clostridia bacterium]
MKIIDKIISLFKRKNIKQLQEGTVNTVKNEYNFERSDGTTISISPVLDRVGNQCYEQVFNNRTGEIQNIPKYNIYAEELKELVHPSILNHTVMIDIDYSMLEDQNVANYVVNHMLNKERMGKIIHEYKNYVGGLQKNEEGKPELEKIVDLGIVEALTATEEERNKMLEQQRLTRDEEYMRSVVESSRNVKVHYKDSHATDLSQEEFTM